MDLAILKTALKESAKIDKEQRLSAIAGVNAAENNIRTVAHSNKPIVLLALLNTYNENYNLGLKITGPNDWDIVLKALKRLREVFESDIISDELLSVSASNNFTTPIDDIPLFMINIMFELKVDDDIATDIFINLLEASAKEENSDKRERLIYEDINLKSLYDYEKRMYNFLKNEDWLSLINEYKKYINFYLSIEPVKELMASLNYPMEEIVDFFKRIMYQVIIKNIYKNIKINKATINMMKKGFPKIIEGNNKVIGILKNYISQIEFNKSMSDETRMNLIETLNKDVGSLNLKLSDGPSTIINKIRILITKLENDIRDVNSILDGLTTNGFKGFSHNIPRLCFSSVGNDPDIQKAILSSIKLNSLYRIIFDNVNSDNLEVKMGSMIDNNLQISYNDMEEFIRIYYMYLSIFLEYLSVSFENHSKDKFEELLNIIVANMRGYILHINTPKIEVEPRETKTKQKIKIKEEKKDPLLEYISNGKVIKICDLEKFKNILESTDLSTDRKNECYRQMVNAINRKINEEKTALTKSLLGNNLEYYSKARTSGMPEALQIVDEIDTLIDLIYEASSVEKEELIIELESNIEILKEIFKQPEVRKNNIEYNILYYKRESVPNILLDLEGLPKNISKQANMALKKIIDGNNNDPIVKGLTTKVWYKGRDFKVFYTKVGSYIIIIGGSSSNNAFNEIKSLVNSREFLTYLKETINLINTNNIPNENNITLDLLEQISNNSRKN